MLRSLELFGFKSFADKTVFEFSSGITGVVGPNGSGKSNVVDSIKWILGDQSARSLRGKEMTDVIFNGSASRGGAQFAEATLVFDNRSRFLPVDIDEVCVGRRLWQSGDSEYLINRVTARLKDVRELFMGTGAGAASYCIIEQGRVDQILQSNAANRRLIFEEAAGIRRFKSRRTEALRRLDRVEQNLVRLADIVDEVESQVNSIRSQAQRAAKFREVSTELEALWIGLAADRYRRESRRRVALMEQMQSAAASLEELRSRQQESRRELDAADASLNRADDLLRDTERSAADVANRRASLHTTLEHLSARSCELDTDRTRLDRQCRLMDSRVSEAHREMKRLEELVAQESEGMNAISLHVRQFDERISELQQSSQDAQNSIEFTRHEILTRVQQNSDLTSSLSAGRTQEAQERKQLESLAATLQTDEQRVETLRQQVIEQEHSVQSAESELTAAEDAADQILQNKHQLASEHSESQQSLSNLREQRSALLARRTILEDLEDRQEGFGIGVREILQRALDATSEPWKQVEGTVADLLDADLDNAALLEVALSGRSQLLVVRSLRPLLDYLESGRSQISGRVGFVSMESATEYSADQEPSNEPQDSLQSGGTESAAPESDEQQNSAQATWWDTPDDTEPDLLANSRLKFGGELTFDGDFQVAWADPRSDSPIVRSVFHQHLGATQHLFRQPGVVGRADGLANSPSRLPWLASALLADTWVVESLSIAMKLHQESGGRWRFVTLQGELLEHNGTLFAGTIRPETAVMSRKSELRRLRNELARIEHEIAEREFAIARLSESLEATDADLSRARQEMSARSHQVRDAQLRKGEFERELHSAEQTRDEKRHAVEQTKQRIDAIVGRIDALTQEVQQGEEHLQQLKDALREKEVAQSAFRREAEQLEEERMSSSVEHSRAEERMLSIRDAQERIREELEQRNLQQAEADRRRQASEKQQREISLRQLNVQGEINELTLDTESFGQRVRDLSAERLKLRSRRSTAMQAEADVQEKCRRQETRHHELDVLLRGIEHQLATTADRIREEYQIEVEEAAEQGRSAIGIWLQRDRKALNSQKSSDETDAAESTDPESTDPESSDATSTDPSSEPSLDDRIMEVLDDEEHFETLTAQIEQQVERLRRRLRSIGNVSTESIDSLTELETRFERLRTQLGDLEAARDSLRQIVRRINTESRRLFLESFECVREHFRDLFRRLFGGGEADLILEDPEDVLECAIDVVARPPGKELRSISLLSGGEKTLTAVALLLSIFKSRPSPFCILDEVDAALDDANIGRFVNVLRDFQQSTQFILITHRKPTMAVTDVLYGVTMEESGISRRLSLRFEDVDEQGNFVPRTDRPSQAA